MVNPGSGRGRSPDEVLVRQLVEHLANKLVHIPLIVPEIIEERLEGGPCDLELGRREIEAVGDLVWLDQVQLVAVIHATQPTSRRRGVLSSCTE